jgi:hypothetical protein
LSKLYLNLRDLDKVVELYRKSPDVNQRLLDAFLEAGMRKNDADLICEGLEKFVEIKRKPHNRVLK